MAITKTDVLTVDALIITGILILLTVSEGNASNGLISFTLALYSKFTILITIIPFSLSALIEIRDVIKNPQATTNATKRGLRLMQYGFVYLMLLVGFIVAGQLYPIFAAFPKNV